MGRRKTTVNEMSEANDTGLGAPVSEPGSFEQESVSGEAIARRAYQLFEERGAEPGYDLDDWYRAEQDLRGQNGNG